MSSKTNIVIIGASFAGIPIAHSLIKDIPSAKVTLINPTPTFYFPIAAPRILAKPSAFRPEQYLLPIEKEFNSYPNENFEFVLGHATSISVEEKNVTVDDKRTIHFDYLVIASGSTTASSMISTDDEVTVFPFKQSGLDNMEYLVEEAQKAISSAKSVVIAGAGPIGVELAGEIAEAAEENGKPVSITLVSATERVLPMLKPGGSETAESLLARKNVEIVKSTKVIAATRSDDAKSWTVDLDNGDQLTADLYIPTTGALPNNSFIPQDFLDENGWVRVDKELRVHNTKTIYAAGDITNNSMRLSFKATEQAAVVAANLKSDILGTGKRRSYDEGNSIMMLVPVGACGGTGQIFGLTPWSTLVWLIKGRDFFISKAQEAVRPR